eukprot:12664961-Ditylum_brightwellii.AAC.1
MNIGEKRRFDGMQVDASNKEETIKKLCPVSEMIKEQGQMVVDKRAKAEFIEMMKIILQADNTMMLGKADGSQALGTSDNLPTAMDFFDVFKQKQ